jgi:hypothetical protein
MAKRAALVSIGGLESKYALGGFLVKNTEAGLKRNLGSSVDETFQELNLARAVLKMRTFYQNEWWKGSVPSPSSLHRVIKDSLRAAIERGTW